jgi:glycosyltransferase involved in cell wall biosynthesis
MKICYLSSTLNIHDYRFLSALTQRQYDVYLVSYANRVPHIPKIIKDIKGLTIIHKRFALITGYWSSFPFVVMDFRHLLKRLKPDILHTGWVTKDGFLGALAGFHPVLLMPYGSDILIEPTKSLLRRMIVKYAINRADSITCDCETVKNAIIEMTGFKDNKIVVFPWGIELGQFYPDPKQSGRVRERLAWIDNKILIMNRPFESVYGIRYFLEALPKILNEEPATRVVLIGTGSLEPQIRALVKDLKLSDVISFIGRVPNEEMAAYLNAADVYVSTSLSDGTSSSLLEAMACALPVVVTDIPANKEWVVDGHNGFLVQPRTPGEVSKQVLTLLKSRSLRKEMGQTNLALARNKADWNKNIDKLEGIYKSLTDVPVQLRSS